jgi:hypothetical protein
LTAAATATELPSGLSRLADREDGTAIGTLNVAESLGDNRPA